MDFAIGMVAGRPLLMWVNKSMPSGRITVGPESKLEEVKAALQIEG